jgi:hypothetical protein
MEKAYYFVIFKQEYLDLMREINPVDAEFEDGETAGRMIIAITQGGFGQDIIDDERQAKERFLEYLFSSSDIDLPRTSEVFDQYFEIDRADEFVDLDTEL